MCKVTLVFLPALQGAFVFLPSGTVLLQSGLPGRRTGLFPLGTRQSSSVLGATVLLQPFLLQTQI